VQPAPDGAIVRVHARPGATKPGIAGLHGDALAVRIRARPVEGRANVELVGLVAGVLGVAASAVTVEAGAHGREKRLRVRGVDASTAAARLASHLPR
jgi:uncharacterized protein (TIGR00251 family)